ncbi:predicted protein [Postia placenta Mad-698-R]|uniref:Uncharacterized protein n=1 Tax=Postia placenta MAD-698-R-SB12 TaxID=670580 RepID=A0A1X6MXR8_9APHY|nr:hypothetical protein POSPLADRAFT_1047426 [Postia placenta MAD-698-R-SB12]EED85675.1 predicted protein [Postia placenta Mad-698-R]OSX61168.1 hypothetical protein POSPLADRAFT_1047426 [Postia placenta MAD-698-R-SB12]
MVCFGAIGGLFALLLPPALMSHSETFAAASDTSFGSANEKQPAARRPTAVKIALRMLKEEGLVHAEASFCFDAFQFCVLVSDFANAKAWARRAWEVACVTAGPESAAARTFKMYWANPRAHRFAGLLPRGVLGGPDSS